MVGSRSFAGIRILFLFFLGLGCVVESIAVHTEVHIRLEPEYSMLPDGVREWRFYETAGGSVSSDVTVNARIPAFRMTGTLEIAASHTIKARDSGEYRISYSPESLLSSTRISWPGTMWRFGVDCSYLLPAQVLAAAIPSEIEVDHRAYHRVVCSFGASRVLDPGAFSWAIQWCAGLPMLIDGIKRFRPADVTATALVTDALHRGLVLSIGFKQQMSLGEVVWASARWPLPELAEELFLMLQFGEKRLTTRLLGSYRFDVSGGSAVIAVEVQYDSAE